MQICMEHWGELRRAISARGLDHLVATSGEEAAEALTRQIEGEDDPRNDFDPLMNANWAIHGQYLQDVGLGALVGQKCPLCEVEKSRAGLATNWIEGCAEDQLQQARALDLVAGVQ
ncbi:hypothetical protein [Oceanibacterium hippocampi]|uniref:Uncharacterized protein n=1 Tax=Oceanibacterium hippocampi TaxID=745714 RepID=A0A1Y5SWG5_9PROT|nr:hypothetical protein [Oceanibacterium hippocampi]SLN50282.1 hypothetical protein OCH7691_02212 [Oceanibacterium hippocampi]